jgi:hypothetical protein
MINTRTLFSSAIVTPPMQAVSNVVITVEPAKRPIEPITRHAVAPATRAVTRAARRVMLSP